MGYWSDWQCPTPSVTLNVILSPVQDQIQTAEYINCLETPSDNYNPTIYFDVGRVPVQRTTLTLIRSLKIVRGAFLKIKHPTRPRPDVRLVD